VLAGLLAAVVVAALALVLVLGGEDREDADAIIPAEPPRTTTIEVGDMPKRIAVVAGDVRVVTTPGITKVSTTRNVVEGSPARLDRTVLDIAADRGTLWAATNDGASGSEAGSVLVVRRFETSVGRLGRPREVVRFRLPSMTRGQVRLAVDERDIWMIDGSDEVRAFDRVTGRLSRRVALRRPPGFDEGIEAQSVSAGEQGVWVATTSTQTRRGLVHRIERAAGGDVTATVMPFRHGLGVGDPIHEGHGALWVASSRPNRIYRLDAATGKLTGQRDLPARPTAIAGGGGEIYGIFVANADAGTVTWIGPRVVKVIGDPIPVGRRPVDIVVGAGSVWIANEADDTVTRIVP